MNSLPLLLIPGVIALLAWRLQKADAANWKPLFWSTAALRIMGGMLVGLVYYYHYHTGDTMSYQADAEKMVALAHEDTVEFFRFIFFGDTFHPLVSSGFQNEQPGAFFFTKIVGFISYFTGANYWLTSLCFSFISFAASWYLVRIAAQCFPSLRTTFAVAFLLFPSVVFWSAGLIKESLALAGLWVIITVFLKAWFHLPVKWYDYLLAAVSAVVVWNIKYYYLGIAAPVLAALVILRWLSLRYKLRWKHEVLFLAVGFILLLLFATLGHPNFYLHRLLGVIVENNQAFVQLSEPGDAIRFYNLHATWYSMLLNAPLALVSCLYRPLPWEVMNGLSLLASVENSVLLVMTLLAVPSLRRLPPSPHRLLVTGALVYCILLATLLSLSAPNFGTLARFRIGFLPVFIVLIAQSPSVQRIFNSLPLLKRL